MGVCWNSGSSDCGFGRAGLGNSGLARWPKGRGEGGEGREGNKFKKERAEGVEGFERGSVFQSFISIAAHMCPRAFGLFTPAVHKNKLSQFAL